MTRICQGYLDFSIVRPRQTDRQLQIDWKDYQMKTILLCLIAIATGILA
jgi:hypothetical protein